MMNDQFHSRVVITTDQHWSKIIMSGAQFTIEKTKKKLYRKIREKDPDKE